MYNSNLKTKRRGDSGFTIMELLVGLSIFIVFSLGVVSFMTSTFRRLGLESRSLMATQELRNALGVLSSELRMSSVISPYLPGTDPSLTLCSTALTVTPTSVKFIVIHDDPTATNGIQPYYVGYSYDSTTKELRRGQIASSSTTSCTVPSGDPISSSVASVIAKKVVPVDVNGDSIDEPIFSFSGSELSINAGVTITGTSNTEITQIVSTQVFARKT